LFYKNFLNNYSKVINVFYIIFLKIIKKYLVFSGIIEAEKIEKYKYVALDETGFIVDEEDIERTYSPENSKINEVYNRLIYMNILFII